MSGARCAGLTRTALAGMVLSMPMALGCAGRALVAEDGQLRHPRHGFSVSIPQQPPWARVSVDAAAVAFRAPGPAFMSLQSVCGRPVAAPEVMARHLVIGLPDRTLRQSGPVSVGIWPGWSQVFDTLQEGVAVRVKTVTIVAKHCTFDWILSAQGGFEEAEPSFDAWWRSFEVDDPAAAGAREEDGE